MKSNKGFLKTIILVIIAILILSYFGFNIKNIAESDTSKSNFSYVWNSISYVYEHFLAIPASFVWNKIIVGIFWELALKPGIQALEQVSRN